MGREERSSPSRDPGSGGQRRTPDRFLRFERRLHRSDEEDERFTTQPGCAYSSRFTSGVAKALMGDKALYEKGKYRYLKGLTKMPSRLSRKLIQDYPQSAWAGSSYYWMEKQDITRRRRMGRFRIFARWLRNILEVNSSRMLHTPADGSDSNRVPMKKAIFFFTASMKKRLPIPWPNLPCSGLDTALSGGRYTETLQEMETLLRKYPEGKWRPEAEYLTGASYFRLKRFKRRQTSSKPFGDAIQNIPWKRALTMH